MSELYRGIINKMTLEEKASLCSGLDFWHTKPISRLNIPGIAMSDGPHGLRRQISEKGRQGAGESAEATCFPAACTTACSFDRALMYEMGKALGEECLDQKVGVLLGPGVNIKRSPLCGRNFEYFSEDPYAAGEMAAALISGIQSKNVGASLKHYAGNSQEKARMVSDSIIDERTLREIYLAGFEKAVKLSGPWTLMSSYNSVNGTYASENRCLLTNILRTEWGFDGVVMSDWGAVNVREAGLAAGLELEMPPAGKINDKRIVDAVNNGSLPEDVLDTAVMRLLKLVDRTKDNERPNEMNYNEHHEMSRKLALESAVLLKNNGLLPAKETQKFAVIGAFAREPRYQGSGSSRINPKHLTCAFDVFSEKKIDFAYAGGYNLRSSGMDAALLGEAVETARGKDIVFVFAGLPDEYESEGFDRTHLELPESHNRLISGIAAVNPNVAVVLYGGAPVVMPWIDEVKSVLMCYLPGESAGEAAFDLLFGKAVPCGKLAETFPAFLSDNPSYPYYGGSKTVEYRESIFVGYRYYDAANKNVLFPFGFGLSYSTFLYKKITVSKQVIYDSEIVLVTVEVENTGTYDASEIVQIYVQPPESRIYKAKKELKGFAKIALKQGETGTVSVELDKRSFSYYNTSIHDWHVESGLYTILGNASSRDNRLSTAVEVKSTNADAAVPDYRQRGSAYYALESNNPVIPQLQFEYIYGAKMPEVHPARKGQYHMNSTLSECRKSVIGRLFTGEIHRRYEAALADDPRPDQKRMMKAMFEDMPLRALVNFSGGEIGFRALDGLLLMMNGHLFRGGFTFLNGLNPK